MPARRTSLVSAQAAGPGAGRGPAAVLAELIDAVMTGPRSWWLEAAGRHVDHLELIENGDAHAVALVAFRDALRADAGLHREYGDLKDKLARQHPGNRNAYTNAKASFVAQALRRAGIEPPPRDPAARVGAGARVRAGRRDSGQASAGRQCYRGPQRGFQPVRLYV